MKEHATVIYKEGNIGCPMFKGYSHKFNVCKSPVIGPKYETNQNWILRCPEEDHRECFGITDAVLEDLEGIKEFIEEHDIDGWIIIEDEAQEIISDRYTEWLFGFYDYHLLKEKDLEDRDKMDIDEDALVLVKIRPRKDG
jgi:hypothetical protein